MNTDLYDQPTSKPTRKVSGGAIAGGASGAAASLLVIAWNATGISPEMTLEAAAVIVAAVTAIGQFAGAYFTREATK